MKAWEELLSSLEIEIGTETVAKWLRPIRVVRFDAANLFLEATPFQQAWFEEQIRPRIKNRFCNNNQRPIKIIWENARNSKKAGTVESNFRIEPDLIEPEYSLDCFVPFESNAMAIQIAREIATQDNFSFNPAYFSGPSGSGKTHLLMGIAKALMQRGKKVFYVNAESFTDHVVQAIRLGRMLEFRKAYREIDALVIDDVHRLARRIATQEEFFHTFNELHTLNRQIILGSIESAQQLQDIEPRLISRFEWGIALKIERPDPTIVRQILEQKARHLDLSAPPELIDFLLKRFPSQPKASVEALHAIALRSPKMFDLRHIEHILTDLLEKENETFITPDKIIKQTAIYFGIRVEDLTGKSQMREFVQPRQIAIYLCRNILQMPFQGIGRLFSRDHSTMISSVKLVEMAMTAKQAPFAEPLKAILKKLHR